MYNRALKLVRQYHGLSQVEAAERLDLSKSYISELEKGVKKPSIEVLERYAVVFALPLSQLMMFAEASEQSFAEGARTYAADKVLRMLEWTEKTFRDRAA